MWIRKKGNLKNAKKNNGFYGMTEKFTGIRIGERVKNPTRTLKIYNYKRRKTHFSEVLKKSVF